jgi:peptide chain release factor 2
MDQKPPKELLKLAKEMVATVDKYWKILNLQEDIDRLRSYEEQSQDPKFWDNADRARDITQKKNELSMKVDPWVALKQEIVDFPDLIEMTLEELGDGATASLNQDYRKLQEKLEELELSEALNGKDDSCNAFINIHPGAGGTESQDWADMLLRMFSRYLDKSGFRYELVDFQEGDAAGIKNATLYVQGEKAFGYLKSESGVHRLVRISPFDSNKRRHTSFASVYVTPELDDTINIEIDEKDLRVDVFRSSGAGGQHVNTTDSAVRMTHIPSGIVVACQNERSQIKNRDTAMKMLKARLYEVEKQKNLEEKEKSGGEKRDIAWGSQIRSYVFHPYNMVKDHRTDHETANVQGVMDGDLESFIMSYLKSRTIA